MPPPRTVPLLPRRTTIFCVSASAAPSQSGSTSVQHTPCRPELYLAAIVLCGLWLRCWQVNESLWLDELHTSWVVAGTPSDISGRAQAGNQSPLYFYMVWGVVQLCGHTPWALRLISLVAGGLLIVAVALLVRRWTHSTSSGLLAALLLALNRDCIFFAQESRPYALLQLSALVHGAVFVAMLKRPTWPNRLLFVSGAAWLFYLHYTAFLLLIAQAVCLAVLLMWREPCIKYRLSQAVCDALLIALTLVPAAEHLLAIAERRDNWSRIVQAWPPPFALQVALALFGVVPVAALLFGRWFRGKAMEVNARGCARHLGGLLVSGARTARLAAYIHSASGALHGAVPGSFGGRSDGVCCVVSQCLQQPLVSNHARLSTVRRGPVQ